MIYKNKFIQKRMNKRGVATFTVIAFLVVALLIIYVILHIPIPAFSKIKNLVNYFMIIIVWLVLQVGLIYGYYRLGLLASKGLKTYRTKIQLWTVNIKNFLITRR